MCVCASYFFCENESYKYFIDSSLKTLLTCIYLYILLAVMHVLNKFMVKYQITKQNYTHTQNIRYNNKNNIGIITFNKFTRVKIKIL